MKDPELADAPDTAEDLAWEARHCANRLESLAELLCDVMPQSLDRARADGQLHQAAMRARRAADLLKGGQP